ncbi:Chitosanase-domain-containing protein [Aspergillus taichungensis]|uniref:Endo-chitosanase n=1 Tax=Aspergillus taichungensis TaxID=482145 RepID=A0A2J5HXE3_9EURO|nr:Chitosanase-domain-containing protein [Aspergillus taichungensis]
MVMKFTRNLALSVAFSAFALGQQVNGPDYDSPTGGPPAKFFAAAASIPVAGLQTAAAKASKVPDLATYPVSLEKNAVKSTIHSDWLSFSEGAALSWVADMDVDCDGIDYKCVGNPDGQDQTNWGALAAYEVPFIVIPQKFLSANENLLSGNNIAAVICNGKMYYGILGDANGDSPQVTGEASWLMARTCFPNDDLNGNKGHTAADVTYILFTGKNSVLPSSALNENYITNFSTLRSMGDKLVNALASNLGLGGSTPTTTSATMTTTSKPSPTGCSWPGHCQGAACSSGDDCADDLVCTGGICSAEGAQTCSWEGHCEGASCSSHDDCSDELACVSGVCSADDTETTCSWEGHCAGRST